MDYESSNELAKITHSTRLGEIREHPSRNAACEVSESRDQIKCYASDPVVQRVT